MTTLNEQAEGSTNENIELLRRILTREQLRDVTYDEAKYIGESLIEFFEVLAGRS